MKLPSQNIDVDANKKIPVSLWKVFVDRKFWMFFGTGLIVSVAYMDPGNWGTNIAGGAEFNYDLLWVIWMASGMAMLLLPAKPLSLPGAIPGSWWVVGEHGRTLSPKPRPFVQDVHPARR